MDKGPCRPDNDEMTVRKLGGIQAGIVGILRKSSFSKMKSEVSPVLYVSVLPYRLGPAIKVLLVIKVLVESGSAVDTQERDQLIFCDQESRDQLGLSAIAWKPNVLQLIVSCLPSAHVQLIKHTCMLSSISHVVTARYSGV